VSELSSVPVSVPGVKESDTDFSATFSRRAPRECPPRQCLGFDERVCRNVLAPKIFKDCTSGHRPFTGYGFEMPVEGPGVLSLLSRARRPTTADEEPDGSS